MNSNDVLNLFASQTVGPDSWLKVLFCIVMAFGVGLAIAFVYRYNYRGVMYSPNFTLTLVLMTLITTPVVLCIKESIQLSMGMVGALSIVRFRTAVKDPLDTAYMFWALTMGILLGAEQFFLTALALVGVGGLITLLTKMQQKKHNSYLLVLRMNDAAERQAAQIVGGIRFQRLRTKTVSQGYIEATYEVRVDKTDALLKRLNDIGGVQDATLVAYTGEGA